MVHNFSEFGQEAFLEIQLVMIWFLAAKKVFKTGVDLVAPDYDVVVFPR